MPAAIAILQDTGRLSNDLVTNDTSLTLNGSGFTANQSVSIWLKSISGNLIQVATGTSAVSVNSSGTFSFVYSTAVPEGTYTLYVSDGNATGSNYSQNSKVQLSPPPTLVIDTTAPAAMQASLTAGNAVSAAEAGSGFLSITGENQGLQTLVLTDSLNNTVTIETIGTGSAQSINLSPSQLSQLANGAVQVTASQVDLAGNLQNGVTQPLTFILDKTSPTVGINSTASNIYVGESVTLTFTFSEEIDPASFTAADITVNVISGSSNPGSLAAPVNRGDNKNFDVTFTPSASYQGTITLLLGAGKVVDLAGNTNTSSQSLNLAIDTVSPTVSISGILDNVGLVQIGIGESLNGVSNQVSDDDTPTINVTLSKKLSGKQYLKLLINNTEVSTSKYTLTGSDTSYAFEVTDATLLANAVSDISVEIWSGGNNDQKLMGTSPRSLDIVTESSPDIDSAKDINNLDISFITEELSPTLSGSIDSTSGKKLPNGWKVELWDSKGDADPSNDVLILSEANISSDRKSWTAPIGVNLDAGNYDFYAKVVNGAEKQFSSGGKKFGILKNASTTIASTSGDNIYDRGLSNGLETSLITTEGTITLSGSIFDEIKDVNLKNGLPNGWSVVLMKAGWDEGSYTPSTNLRNLGNFFVKDVDVTPTSSDTWSTTIAITEAIDLEAVVVNGAGLAKGQSSYRNVAFIKNAEARISGFTDQYDEVNGTLVLAEDGDNKTTITGTLVDSSDPTNEKLLTKGIPNGWKLFVVMGDPTDFDGKTITAANIASGKAIQATVNGSSWSADLGIQYDGPISTFITNGADKVIKTNSRNVAFLKNAEADFDISSDVYDSTDPQNLVLAESGAAPGVQISGRLFDSSNADPLTNGLSKGLPNGWSLYVVKGNRDDYTIGEDLDSQANQTNILRVIKGQELNSSTWSATLDGEYDGPITTFIVNGSGKVSQGNSRNVAFLKNAEADFDISSDVYDSTDPQNLVLAESGAAPGVQISGRLFDSSNADPLTNGLSKGLPNGWSLYVVKGNRDDYTIGEDLDSQANQTNILKVIEGKDLKSSTWSATLDSEYDGPITTFIVNGSGKVSQGNSRNVAFLKNSLATITNIEDVVTLPDAIVGAGAITNQGASFDDTTNDLDDYYDYGSIDGTVRIHGQIKDGPNVLERGIPNGWQIALIDYDGLLADLQGVDINDDKAMADKNAVLVKGDIPSSDGTWFTEVPFQGNTDNLVAVIVNGSGKIGIGAGSGVSLGRIQTRITEVLDDVGSNLGASPIPSGGTTDDTIPTVKAEAFVVTKAGEIPLGRNIGNFQLTVQSPGYEFAYNNSTGGFEPTQQLSGTPDVPVPYNFQSALINGSNKRAESTPFDFDLLIAGGGGGGNSGSNYTFDGSQLTIFFEDQELDPSALPRRTSRSLKITSNGRRQRIGSISIQNGDYGLGQDDVNDGSIVVRLRSTRGRTVLPGSAINFSYKDLSGDQTRGVFQFIPDGQDVSSFNLGFTYEQILG